MKNLVTIILFLCVCSDGAVEWVQLGITQGVVSRIERGRNVSIDTLVRYATACGGKLKVQLV